MAERKMLLIPVTGDLKMVNVPTLDAMRAVIDDAAALGPDRAPTWIERVRVGEEWSLAVDEEGLLKRLPVNERASVLYGTLQHGQPIVGPALLGKEGYVGDGLDWVDVEEAEAVVFMAARGQEAGANG